jgi:SAM-dependent methyltransferase
MKTARTLVRALRGGVRNARRLYGLAGVSAPSRLPPGTLVFACNLCSARSALPVDELQREGGRCGACGAIMRYRAVIHHLSVGLFGESLAADDFPRDAARLAGIGMSDPDQYADLLARRFRYTNTFYHAEPKLDIRSPEARHVGAYDFVVSSDVFEHVDPPVAPAFRNLRRMLKPRGLLVLTVPFVTWGETVEHFPELHHYAIEDRRGKPVLVNRTADGRTQEFTDLVFHGGPGHTLEMRVFSEAGLRHDLEEAGFTRIEFHREPCFARGIYWAEPWSVPVTAIADGGDPDVVRGAGRVSGA